MRTFKEFMYLTERYYKPHELLPSGKTPLGKAVHKQETRRVNLSPNSNIRREVKHDEKIQTKVIHGADNKHYNDRMTNKEARKIYIDAHKDEYMTVHHPSSGVQYHVTKGADGIHSVEWTHGKNKENMSRAERVKLARDAKRVWDKHVSHRLPYGAILHNKPSQSRDEKGNIKPVNRRAQIYKKHGFGEVDKDNDQFARVNREPSPKQKKKGKSRLSPLRAQEVKKSVGWDEN